MLCAKSKSYPDLVSIKHPARHYIYYLLSQRIYDAKGVYRKLQEMGLPAPDQDHDEFNFEQLMLEILRTRAAMTFPLGFNPRKKPIPPATMDWLKEWRLKDMWCHAPSTVEATKILNSPEIRHLLELLLLGPLSPWAIAERLRVRFGLEFSAMNAAIVKSYGHYFWDTGAMNSAQWRKFLALHYKSSQTEFGAALNAPRSAAGAAFTIAIADKDPQSLNPADRYETASSMAFGMMMHHALSCDHSTGDTYAAATALGMMRMADEELARHRGASTDLIDELTRLETVYDQKKPRQITDSPYIHRQVIDVESTEVKDAPDE